MDITGKQVAILVHNYFEQAEFEEPRAALQNAGGTVTVISADKHLLQALNHVSMGDSFEADLLLERASPTDYDGLVLPGGAINADSLRIMKAAQRWAADFLEAGKPVAAICHAPWLLVSADTVEGRRLTSYHTICDDIVNAGGEWVNLPVVVDGNLITSRQPDDLPQFNEALLHLLSSQTSPSAQNTEPMGSPQPLSHDGPTRPNPITPSMHEPAISTDEVGANFGQFPFRDVTPKVNEARGE